MKDRKPKGFFKYKTNEQLEEYITENHYKKNIKDFQKDGGAYNEVIKRGLLDDFVKREILFKKGYNPKFKNLNDVIAEAKKIKKKHKFKTLPHSEKLRKLGYKDFICSVHKYSSNLPTLRKLLKEESIRKENGQIKNLDYIIIAAKRIMKKYKLKTLPSAGKLKKLHCASLSNAITQYHGGFQAFRKILGEKQLRKQYNLFKNIDNIILEVSKIKKEYGFDTLPSPEKLRKLGYSTLVHYIQDYHGGFPAFREILNQKLGIQSERQQLENLLDGYLKQ